MVERTNSGDKEALRELMSRCTRPMYDRALVITGDVYAAKDAVRRALRELAEAQQHGECPEDVDSWAILLAERSCDEELYYKRLIDGMIAGLPLAAHEKRPLCNDNPARESSPEEDAVSDRTYAIPESVPQAVFAPERRPMPSAEQMERAVEMPAVQKPAKEEPEEDDSIFAPKKKNPRTLRQELPIEDMSEDEHEEYDYFAPKKGKNKRHRGNEVPDLFGDEAVIEENDYDEVEESKSKGGGGLLALLIIVLTLVAAGLLWVIAVKLATLGYLGISDLGFADWFNEHLFKFY
jgi:hypothetical protein